jgi:hypothetical protein
MYGVFLLKGTASFAGSGFSAGLFFCGDGTWCPESYLHCRSLLCELTVFEMLNCRIERLRCLLEDL